MAANFDMLSSTDSLQLQHFEPHQNKKALPVDMFLGSKYLQNACATGASSLTSLGEQPALPSPLGGEMEGEKREGSPGERR